MSRVLPWMILIGIATVLATVSFSNPELLNDNNSFLKGFVNQELLATLGFILAVTLASAASLHLELNKLQDETGKTFDRTRRNIKQSSYCLLGAFLGAVFLVILKPLLPPEPYNAALANAAAILLIYFNIFTLFDLTRLVFHIPSAKMIKERNDNVA